MNPMNRQSRIFGGVIRHTTSGITNINSDLWGDSEYYPKVFEGEAL
jgi:hypothetical protein